MGGYLHHEHLLNLFHCLIKILLKFITYLNTSLVSYNVLLTNYLNKYHPFIFFTSTWFSFKFLFNSTGYYFSSYKYKSLVILKEQKRLNLRLLVLVLLALSLGGV